MTNGQVRRDAMMQQRAMSPLLWQLGMLLLTMAARLGTAISSDPPGWLTEANTDAVVSGTSACTSLPHKVCVGAKQSAAACETTCSDAPTCSVWAWSASTHHCWHRTDKVWDPQSASGVTSGCSRTRVGAACAAPPPPAPVSPDVTVAALPWQNNTAVSPHTPAVALDWWVKEDSKYGFQWGDTSILVLDLQNPMLRAVASSLAPAVLRLGGSPIDSIEYAMTPGAKATCARGKGTPGGSAGFTCSQTGLASYGCFTGDRWRELLEFGKATGLRIVLGLNACNGRHSVDSPMDFTNIQSLLNYTTSLPAEELTALAGFEFGNEILNTGVKPTRWADDANLLASLIRHSFEGAGLEPPPLIGPDHYSLQGYAEVLSALEKDTLSAVTYHDYPQCTPAQEESGMVLQPSCLAKLDATAAQATRIVASYGAEVWDGEGADHTATGGDFGHDFLPTFQSSHSALHECTQQS